MALRLSTKVAIILLKATAGLSIILGLLPFKYNFKKRALEASRIMLIYSIVMYAGIITTLFFIIPDVIKKLDLSLFREKPLSGIINAVELAAGIFTLLVALFRNWTGRQNLLSIYNEMQSIYCDYFKQCNLAVRESDIFNSFVIVQSCVTLCQTVMGWCTIMSMRSVFSFDFLLMSVLLGTLQSVIFLIKNHFNNAMLFVYIGFVELNKDLESLVDMVEIELVDPRRSIARQQLKLGLDAKIANISLIYQRLLLLSQRIVKSYQLQILLLVATSVISNIVNCFCFLIVIKINLWKYDMFVFLLFPQLVVSNLMEFWLSITVCEFTINAASSTPNILRRFGTCNSMDDASVKSLETFSLFLTQNKLQFRLCNVIVLNHRTGYAAMETTILYLIYLVQFDYENL